MQQRSVIDSSSQGDAVTFRPLEVLRAGLAALPPAPREAGRIALLVRRGESGRRETPERVRLTPQGGLPGDAWGRAPEPKPEAQLAVMQHDIAALIANGQPLTLFGDNLFLELDLSAANVPIGSRLRSGAVLLEVTPKPHNGCLKFRGRFGDAALQFVAAPVQRHLNLRGIYLQVVEEGEIAVGDPVAVVSRPAT